MEKNAITAEEFLDSTLESETYFSIGDCLSRGFDIWKKSFFQFTLFFVVLMIIYFTLIFIPIVGQLAISLVVGPALSLGAVIYAYRIYMGEEVNFSNFFDGFAHWKELILLQLIVTLGYFLLIIPILLSVGLGQLFNSSFDFLEFSTMLADMKIETLTVIILGVAALVVIYLAVCISLAPLFIGFFQLDAISSLKYSFRFVNRKWFVYFILLIVAALVALSGIIGLFIGLFVTIPMIYCFQFAAFEEFTNVSTYYDMLNENYDEVSSN